MIRALSILAAVAALAISATPVASAYTSIGGGKDRGWFHGTSGDGEKFVQRGAAKVAAAPVAAARTSNAKFISREGQFRG